MASRPPSSSAWSPGTSTIRASAIPIDGRRGNLLGRPGAAFADLAMQFFGFAVIGIVFPLGFWGWSLFRLRRPRRPIHQALLWLVGIAALSTAFACLPVLAQWPLPTGLGGAVGDLTLGVANGSAAARSRLASTPRSASSWAASRSGFSSRMPASGRRPPPPAADRVRRDRRRRRMEDDDEDGEEESASGTHSGSPPARRRNCRRISRFSAKAALGRAIRRQLAQRAERLGRMRAHSRNRTGASRSSSPTTISISTSIPEFDDAFAEAIDGTRRRPRARAKAVVQPAGAAPEAERPRQEGGAAFAASLRRLRAAAAASPAASRRSSGAARPRSTRARSSRMRGSLKACWRISASRARSSTSARARSSPSTSWSRRRASSPRASSGSPTTSPAP